MIRAAATALALQLFWQSLAAAQEPPRLVESIEVDLVSIDVVVTDRKGNRVYGLKRDDFRVLDDGIAQQITNFSEYREEAAANAGSVTTAGAPVAPQQQKRQPLSVVVFVDNSSLHLDSRVNALAEARKFVLETLRPGDRASVVAWNRELSTILPLVDDPKRISEAFEAASSRLASGSDRENEAREAREREAFRKRADSGMAGLRSSRSRAEASTLDSEFTTQMRFKALRRTTEAVRSVMTRLSGIEGRKIVVIITEGFDSNAAGISAYAPANAAFDTTKYMQALVDSANSYGVSLYTIHARGLEPPGSGIEQMEAPEDPFADKDPNAKLTNSTRSLGLLSESSGGLMSFAPLRLSEFFREVRADLGSYYSLGYLNRSGKSDTKRALRVETVNRDYVVRSRNSAITRSEETKIKDRVLAALFHGGESDELNVQVSFGKPRRSGRREYLIPVEVKFPIGSLTFLRQGGQHAGGFAVYAAASAALDDSPDVSVNSQRINIPDDKFAAANQQFCVYSIDVKSEGSGGVLAIAVRDEVSGTTSIRRVDLP